ncbi:MAG: bifunctional phosphoribosylaminoimidazolecarboxamide formyltransferase/IMP cyclohydrolase, partial [Candidatus Acidiferrum sp.]
MNLRPIRRALLSVSDKTGLVVLARGLSAFGVELISTGGTAKALADAGLTARDVSDLTGFPEMLDGRVKTLHPKVHGGILAKRDNAEHMKTIAEHGIVPIDLVVVNLYPFERTAARPNVSHDEVIENIDIGGPSMVRSAAKNHTDVAVVTDPKQYGDLLNELHVNNGSLSLATRESLAAAAFARTAAYDKAISGYFAKQQSGELPSSLRLEFPQHRSLRYG